MELCWKGLRGFGRYRGGDEGMDAIFEVVRVLGSENCITCTGVSRCGDIYKYAFKRTAEGLCESHGHRIERLVLSMRDRVTLK